MNNSKIAAGFNLLAQAFTSFSEAFADKSVELTPQPTPETKPAPEPTEKPAAKAGKPAKEKAAKPEAAPTGITQDELKVKFHAALADKARGREFVAGVLAAVGAESFSKIAPDKFEEAAKLIEGAKEEAGDGFMD